MFYIGIDIGGTKIAVGIFNNKRELVKKSKLPTDTSVPASCLSDEIIAEIDKLLLELCIGRKDISGIGIGCPSTVDFSTGIVNYTNNIPNLSDFNLKEYFEKQFFCGVTVDNDANLAALAEYRRGAGRGFKDMMYCTASTGIGGGFILNGRLYRGANGYAGESGHSIITPGEGVKCSCGNYGCIESYASGANISKHVKLRLERGETTVMTELAAGGEVTGVILAEAFRLNDKMAVELLDQIGKYIGILLFNIYQILNVNCYVIGGGLAKGFGDELYSRIERSFSSFVRANNDPVYFKPAELNQDFGIIGACEVLFNE